MPDGYSRDYDVRQVKKADKDARFLAAAKEGILTQVVYFIIVTAGITAGYLLSPDDPEKVTYVFGMFPVWQIVGVAIYLLGTIGLLIYFMKAKTFSFAPRDNDNQDKENGGLNND